MVHLPLHRFLAQRLAAKVLERVAGKGPGRRSSRRLSVLHIGPHGDAFAACVPEHRVHHVAPALGAEGELVATPLALPFLDQSFDVVVAIDAVHLLPPTERQHLLGEALRVARGQVLLVGPFAGKAVDAAERELDGVGEELGWSSGAPRAVALPRRLDLERSFRRRGCQTQAVGLGPAQRLPELARLVAALEQEGLDELAEALREGLVAEVGRAPWARQALLATLPNAVPNTSPAPSAAPGTVASPVELAAWSKSPGRSPKAPKLAEREHRALVALAEARHQRVRALERRIAPLEGDLAQQAAALTGAQVAIEELGLAVLAARRQVGEAEANAHREQARLLERTRAQEAERGELRGDLVRLRADRDGLERVAAELTAALECLSQGLEGALGPEPWPMPQFGDGPLLAQLREERDAALGRADQLQRDVESLLGALADAAGKEPTWVGLEDGSPWDIPDGDTGT